MEKQKLSKKSEPNNEPFERGKWRKATKEELKKYSKQYAFLYEGLKGWYFGKSIEFVEENNSEGGDRLLLVSRDDNGHYGVNIGMDIKL